MPLVTAPNIIEVSDFSSGWSPDLEDSSVPANGLLNVQNLLPDIGTGTLQVRKGFKRLAKLTKGYRILSLHPYVRLVGATTARYLMAVASTGDANTPDNVRVYAINLADGTVTKVNPLATWASGDARHWGTAINDTFYGGGPGDPMYSWNPDDGWVADPSLQDFNLIVTGTPGANQKSDDFAFEKGERVLGPDGQAYEAIHDNRFKPWKDGAEYKKGDRVTLRTGAGADLYLRSYRCDKKHTAAAGNKPGTGAGYWTKLHLGMPRDDDNNVSPAWNLVPSAAQTNVAVWHASRLFMRFDDVNSTGRGIVLFSAPSTIKGHSTGIAEPHWDPKDFRLSQGGGWLPDMFEQVTALHSFGYYLFVFTRNKVKVVAGTNPDTWVFRDLAPVGAIGPRAVCEHEGLVYFLSDQGLYQSDGTTVVPAPGTEKVQDWIREAGNWSDAQVGANVSIWSHDGFVWMALPADEDRWPSLTLVYDPNTKSFWKTDLEVTVAAKAWSDGIAQLFFASPTKVGTMKDAQYWWIGTPQRSQSVRYRGAIEVNLFSDPSFEPKKGETIKQAMDDVTWATTSSYAHRHHSVEAKLRGKLGMVLENARPQVKDTHGRNIGWDPTHPDLLPSPQFIFEGMYQTFADESTGQHTISMFVRRTWWHKKRHLDYGIVRLAVGNQNLPFADHTFHYVGRGWWRVSATYTGSVMPRKHGIVIAPGHHVHVDKALAQEGGLASYFDGSGGDDDGVYIKGGDTPLVYQYDHPDVQEEPSDDTGDDTYDSDDIPWMMRTAWFPFGTLREERRIRRVWALIRGSAETQLRGFRNYSERAAFDTFQPAEEHRPVSWAEGARMPDAFAVSVRAEGVGAPAAVLGVSLDTQPRRIRYHRDNS